MKRASIITAFAVALMGVGCGGDKSNAESSPAAAPPGQERAGQESNSPVTFTDADLEKLERGLRREIEAVKTARAKAGSAKTAQERGEAMQAEWDTATIPLGAETSGLPEARYRDVRRAVDRVFTVLDFQNKIDGPLSIDLERAGADMKAKVSGDAFAGLPPEAAAALRARMDRLVPIWSEYKTLVAVAG
jgi:hypothetical protein